jgi:hypothetical protein
MDHEGDLPHEIEKGSDELLADDHLRLPEGASFLVRIHAVRSWLTRRQQEANLAIGRAALALQDVMEQRSTKLRRREQLAVQERIQDVQQQLQVAQQQLQAFEEAEALFEECIAHTTSSERALVEYYLSLEDLMQEHSEESTALSASPVGRRSALAEVQRRVEHVGIAQGEDE